MTTRSASWRWRGRSREDLLAGLHAARGGAAVDPGEPGGVPLADCLGSFFALPAPLPVTRPPAASSASVLDQVPPLGLAVRGRPLADLLRPAYDSFAARRRNPP